MARLPGENGPEPVDRRPEPTPPPPTAPFENMQPHIEFVIDSLRELCAESERDDKHPKPLGMRALFVGVLDGTNDLRKAVDVIRKRMRERK